MSEPDTNKKPIQDAPKNVAVPFTEVELISLHNIIDSKRRELAKSIARAKLPASTGLEQIDADNAARGLDQLDPIEVKVKRAMGLFR